MTSLIARSATAGYGQRVALRDADIELTGGELVAVIGPNGAGKSTLVRVLAGLLRPRSGAVTLDGVDLRALDRGRIARRIAVVPQVFDTLFPFSVREVVGLGRTARLGLLGRAGEADRVAVRRAMGELDLGALASRPIDALSGGERQRALLAMALAQEADVLLLGSRVAGFWGVFLAIPVAGVINSFVRYFYELAQGRRERTQAASLLEERDAAAAAAAAEARGAAVEAREAARVARDTKLVTRGK